MHSSIALARGFLTLAAPDRLSHMKLQKLLYMAYGWWLVDHVPRLSDEPPCLFRLGPVFPILYERLNATGNVPLALDALPGGEVLSQEAQEMLAWTWGRYGRLSAVELASLAHANGSPWMKEAEAWDFKVPPNTPIPIDRLRQAFRNLRNHP